MANQPTHDEIRIRAYEIYLARGGDHGWDEQDWLQAERELIAELNPRSAGAAAGSNSTAATSDSSTGQKREAGFSGDAKASNAPSGPQRVEGGGRGAR